MDGDVRGEDGGPRVVRPRWDGVILVCGKCCKRHGAGKAVRRALKTGAAAAGGRRKVRVITAGCMKLCPKRAVVVASAATLATGEVVLLRDEADAVRALPRLLPGGEPATAG